jgi:hypothetical protein
VVPQGLFEFFPIFLFWCFLELFLGFFVAEFWRRFFAGFAMGVTHEDLVPLFLVTLLLQTHGKLSDLVVFVGVLHSWLSSCDPRFPSF